MRVSHRDWTMSPVLSGEMQLPALSRSLFAQPIQALRACGMHISAQIQQALNCSCCHMRCMKPLSQIFVVGVNLCQPTGGRGSKFLAIKVNIFLTNIPVIVFSQTEQRFRCDQLSGVPFHSQCPNTAMWVNGPSELQFVAIFVVWCNDCAPSKVCYSMG